MIALSGRFNQIGTLGGDSAKVLRITNNSALPLAVRAEHCLVDKESHSSVPEGFAAYARFPNAALYRDETVHNLIELPSEFEYLGEGDVVRLDFADNSLKVIYRRESLHNSILLTERCNSFCLMCSQPPRDIDDGYIFNDLEKAIPLISPETVALGFTGGEPTLLGDRFLDLIRLCKSYLPRTSLHILSNGRNFKNRMLAGSVASIRHPDLMIGIPLYSDVSEIHDFVVQANGAYDETIRGIVNLKAEGIPVEVRVVVHRQTYERLPRLAEFITRNLTFVDQVAIMGLEMMGFTKANLEALWIDPVEYRKQLQQAVHSLDRSRIRVSIYNHQLCLLPHDVQRFSVKSISDWKNEYMPECAGCTRRHECGGFFSSAALRHSSHIKPYN
jgi:His-Xaa-Ser system radical SAM maturase HxsC